MLGYERVDDSFFIQVYSRSWNFQYSKIAYGLKDLEIIATGSGVKIPPALLQQLQDEADGTKDTNTVKDWRRPRA